MNEYLKAQSKTNETIIAGFFNADELNRLSKSDFRWADNRKKPFQFRTVKKGEVYQMEFGKNYVPEMSYEHRGLVIGVKKKLLYVLPIFSYSPTKHSDVYHPTDFPNSKSDLFLLKSQDFSFLTHDSVLKLNDIRTVSINRILYQHTGRMNLNSDTYRQIESLTLQKYFPEVRYELAKKETALKTASSTPEGIYSSASRPPACPIPADILPRRPDASPSPLQTSNPPHPASPLSDTSLPAHP